MDLFDQNNQKSTLTPLAERMRPRTLDEMAGQQHLIGPQGILRKLIAKDQISSLILFGPPGTGKTTLGRVVADATNSRFVAFSAVFQGVKDIRGAILKAREEKNYYNRKTILFLDEIHRLAKNQQDALLHGVETGDIVLIGATTENPSFEINNALLSRSRVFVLNPLEDEEVAVLLDRAISEERGLGSLNLNLQPKARELLSRYARGDARIALNTLELAAQLAREGVITRKEVEDALQEKLLLYDKKGEEHYNVISAFIKSLRGSSPSGALYWLARLIEAGEDPLFIARRMVILASEDIGNADPRALQVAVAAMQAVHFVGLPEGRINLAQAATYLATAPKSNASYLGINEAQAEVRNSGAQPVPLHLRNAPTKLMKEMGYSKGYKYAHDFEGGFVDQNALPKGLGNQEYYRPTQHGYEKTIGERMAFWKTRIKKSDTNDE